MIQLTPSNTCDYFHDLIPKMNTGSTGGDFSIQHRVGGTSGLRLFRKTMESTWLAGVIQSHIKCSENRIHGLPTCSERHNPVDTYPGINDVEIERVSELKNLGVVINENLSWKSHTNILSNKMTKCAGILNRFFFNIFPLYVMGTLYFSMLGSDLNYELLAWWYAYNRRKKIQKRITQTITLSKYSAPSEPLLRALDIL